MAEPRFVIRVYRGDIILFATKPLTFAELDDMANKFFSFVRKIPADYWNGCKVVMEVFEPKEEDKPEGSVEFPPSFVSASPGAPKVGIDAFDRKSASGVPDEAGYLGDEE